MEIEREHKVPGGKLIRIRARIEDERIASIAINGDFFLHPETVLEAIEEELIGSRLDEVSDRVQRTLDEHHAQLIGCSPEDIEATLRRID